MNPAIRMMTVPACLLAGSFGLVGAQGHEHEKPTDPGVHHHESTGESAAHHTSQPLGISESRNASGTAWQPDSTPMYGLHFSRGEWSMMAHWNFFAGYDDQGSDRGNSEWTAPNWGMLMQNRPVGKGVLAFREMLSLDP